MNRKSLILAGIFFFLLLAIPLTVFLVKQQQDVRSRAQQTETGGTCEAPAQVQNVRVNYPNCE